MLLRIISLLPPSFIRLIGRLQFQFPFLGKIFRYMAGRMSSNEGIIKYGLGAGLRFNATGGNPGYLLGTTEPEEQDTLQKYLKEGVVFYDLGANIGFYSSIAARIVGPKGHVYAFEPFPVSASAARLNAELNDFHNVDVIEAAVSDKAGTASFELGESSRNHKISDSQGELQVPCISLDEYIKTHNLRLPDVMMIDIEGAEIDALHGMSETVRTSLPVIICEVHWIKEEMHEYIKTVLQPLGYTVSTLNGDPIPNEIARYHALMVPNSLASKTTSAQSSANLGHEAAI